MISVGVTTTRSAQSGRTWRWQRRLGAPRSHHLAKPRSLFHKENCAAQGLERCAVDLFREKEVAAPDVPAVLVGSFEFANHGTVYLDEVGPCRALLSQDFFIRSRRGKSRARDHAVDVRVIASTVHGDSCLDVIFSRALQLQVSTARPARLTPGLTLTALDAFSYDRNSDRVTSQNFSSGGSQELWTDTFSRGLNWQMAPLNSPGGHSRLLSRVGSL
jgi:hypothetical protein